MACFKKNGLPYNILDIEAQQRCSSSHPRRCGCSAAAPAVSSTAATGPRARRSSAAPWFEKKTTKSVSFCLMVGVFPPLLSDFPSTSCALLGGLAWCFFWPGVLGRDCCDLPSRTRGSIPQTTNSATSARPIRRFKLPAPSSLQIEIRQV